MLRQGQVDDRALRLLVDADWSALDVSGCARLTDDGLLAALRLTPAVRWLDVTGCSAGAVVLRALPSLCPRITVLRIGEDKATPLGMDSLQTETSCNLGKPLPIEKAVGKRHSVALQPLVLRDRCALLAAGGRTAADEAAACALRHIAPQIRQPDAAQESWELAASDDSAGADVSDRLTQLTHVVWPAIPERLHQRLAVQCPKLQINAFKNAIGGRQVIPDPSVTSLILVHTWFPPCAHTQWIVILGPCQRTDRLL